MPPFAHADAVSHARIVRLSFLEGDVAYQNQSSGSTWERAVQNLPIREGFSLRTDSGYAEVEFESGLVAHLAGNTQLEFTELSLVDGHKVTALKLDQGTMIVTANSQKGDEVTIVSGSGLVTLPRNGRVRIDSTQSQNWVTVLHGKADVVTGNIITNDKISTPLESGKTLHYGATQSGDENLSTVDRSPRTDAFDKWAATREEAQQNAQSDSEEFLRPRDYAFSTADLYNYGLWSNISGYGMAWQPYGMGANWMPFSNGMWMFDDMGADWMWASGEPWGWLPYHYGGWVFLDGEGWFWLPQDLGYFRGGNASFVNVGNQLGWTPTLAAPTNPKKVRTSPVTPTSPVRVVFAGNGSKGVIVAGPRGIIAPTAPIKVATQPAATFTQTGAPTLTSLSATGVTVTSRGPMSPGNTLRVYSPRGSAGGIAGGGAPRSGAPVSIGAPPVAGRPTVTAPHSAPVAVMRPPSTFAVAGSGGRNSGITPVTSSSLGSGARPSGGGVGGPTSTTAANGSNGGGAGHPTGGAAPPTGGSAPVGGGAPAPGGTKH